MVCGIYRGEPLAGKGVLEKSKQVRGQIFILDSAAKPPSKNQGNL